MLINNTLKTMFNMGKRRKKRKKPLKIEENSISLRVESSNDFLGFPLNKNNINQLWRWDTLETVNL